MSCSNEELAQRIEQLVREHIAASLRAAQEGVERAFSGASPSPTARRKPASRAATKSRAGGRRRPPEEVAAIGERLYAAICEHPGEGMARLAKEVGVTVRDLHRPMTRLRDDGRIRSIGSRHLTRYFPMVAGTASA